MRAEVVQGVMVRESRGDVWARGGAGVAEYNFFREFIQSPFSDTLVGDGLSVSPAPPRRVPGPAPASRRRAADPVSVLSSLTSVNLAPLALRPPFTPALD